MSPLDTQLRSTIPTETAHLDHQWLQRRGRRRRIAARVAAGSTGTAALAAAVVLATSNLGPASIDPAAPAAPGAPTASTSPAPAAPDSEGSPMDRLRQAMDSETPADLDVTQMRHLRVVSSVVQAGEDVEEWASIAVLDQQAQDSEVTITYSNAGLREGTTTTELRDLLSDISSEPAPLTSGTDDRWLPSGPAEPTTGGFQGDQQLDDATTRARGDDTVAAAQRLADAMLSLSAGAEGDYWRNILDVLDQLDPEQITTGVDLLGRDVTTFLFTAGNEQLQLNFDPATGRPSGIDMLVATGETDDHGTALLHREVVIIP